MIFPKESSSPEDIFSGTARSPMEQTFAVLYDLITDARRPDFSPRIPHPALHRPRGQALRGLLHAPVHGRRRDRALLRCPPARARGPLVLAGLPGTAHPLPPRAGPCVVAPPV